jgi:hypothetical protein
MDTVGWAQPAHPSAAASGVPLPFGLPQVLAIMTALAAFNPDAAATMQFINTELLDQLANGTPLGEAMVNVSLLLSPPVGGDLDLPIDAVLNQIGPMFALAPTVIGGAMTVLAAIPEAVLPVVGAVVTAFVSSAAAVGSDNFAAAVQTGLYNVMTAAAKGIATMVKVVQNVLHDIQAVVTNGSAARIAAPAAAERLNAPSSVQASTTTTTTTTTTTRTGTKTKRATASATPQRGVAGSRLSHPASASATSSRNRPASSTHDSVKRHARAAGAKGTAESAR